MIGLCVRDALCRQWCCFDGSCDGFIQHHQHFLILARHSDLAMLLWHSRDSPYSCLFYFIARHTRQLSAQLWVLVPVSLVTVVVCPRLVLPLPCSQPMMPCTSLVSLFFHLCSPLSLSRSNAPWPGSAPSISNPIFHQTQSLLGTPATNSLF